MRNLFIAFGLLVMLSCPVFAETGFVESVIDGRTLKLVSGETIRLIGVDLPLTGSMDQDAIAKKQKETADFMRGLVSGYLVELEYDVQKQDDEGNLLAYVWFEYEGSADNSTMAIPENYDSYLVNYKEGSSSVFVFLNSTLIKAGHGNPSHDTINVKHAKVFSDLYAKRVSKDSLAKAEDKDGLQTVLNK